MDLLGLCEKVFLPFFQADRIDEALALNAFQACLDHGPLRTVDHDRDDRDFGLCRDQVEEGRHHLFRIEHPLVHVHVEDVGTSPHLIERNLRGGRVILFLDQVHEAARARHVGAFADYREDRVGSEAQAFEAAEVRDVLFGCGHRARRHSADGFGDFADVIGRRSAAAANQVDEAAGRELSEQSCGRLRSFVVAAECVGQPGVRIGADGDWCSLRELREKGAHLCRSERAVDSHRDWVRMGD